MDDVRQEWEEREPGKERPASWLDALDDLVGAIEDAAWDMRDIGDRAADLWRDLETDWSRVAEQAQEVGREISRWPARVSRLATTGFSLAQLVTSYRLHGTRAAFLSSHEAAEALDALHDRNSRRFYQLSILQGGAFIKVGQLLSSRPDLLPDVWIRQLSTLQDSAPEIPRLLNTSCSRIVERSRKSRIRDNCPEPL